MLHPTPPVSLPAAAQRVGNWPASDVVWGAKCEVPISEAATWVQLMAWLEVGAWW